MADCRACFTLSRLLLPADGDKGVPPIFAALAAANETRGEYLDEGGALGPPDSCELVIIWIRGLCTLGYYYYYYIVCYISRCLLFSRSLDASLLIV